VNGGLSRIFFVFFVFVCVFFLAFGDDGFRIRNTGCVFLVEFLSVSLSLLSQVLAL
jgi:hypothetical protein